jgi:hypothetical protein
MLYNESSELIETTSLKGLLSEKANWEHIHTKEEVDVLLIDPQFQTTDDNLLTFYGTENTTLKALLADKMTIQDLQQAVTALDLPKINNPEFTGVLKINTFDVESEINSKLNATDPTINTTSDDLIMFTGVNNTSLKALLTEKLNSTALDNTVVTTNTLTDPVIVGVLNYKETSSDADSRNLISEISNKANLNAPNFSTSLQLNSTNVLLQPGDFNGTLQAYIELKAPEQIPPDISGLVSKPADYNGDLESYIQLKAPEPDLSGYADRDEVFENLTNYMPGWKINNKFNEYTNTDGMYSELNNLYGQILNISELGNYTTTAGINTKLGTYATTVDISDWYRNQAIVMAILRVIFC